MKRSQAKDGKVRFSHLEEDSASEVDASPDYHSAPSQEDSDRGDESDVATASTSSPSKCRKRHPSQSEIERLRYQMINERVVEDVTVEIFYKPRSITVLVAICSFLLLPAFMRDNERTDDNAFIGLIATGVLFLVISALAFPNGPFIRPHPVFWRIIFGLSVIYVMILQFALFQNFNDIKLVFKWLDPEGLSRDKLEEKTYAANCSDITLERIWSYMDIFVLGHFLGWAMKALLIRHSIICWYISIAWEVTEYFFAHLLPNFEECWWDAIILDILLCNGLGILLGIKVAEYLEMRMFHWESIKNIKTTRGKFKRAILQFTPESWTKVDWLSGNWLTGNWLRRIFAIYAFVMIWLVSELNTFFLKHIFAVDTTHPVVFWRIILIALISAPSIRQFYLFATDPRLKRMGMQSWVYLALCALEAAVCIKFGRPMFPNVQIKMIVEWIALLFLGTLVCVWFSVWWAKRYAETEQVDGNIRYLDSSCENLGLIADDVKARRKKLQLSESDIS